MLSPAQRTWGLFACAAALVAVCAVLEIAATEPPLTLPSDGVSLMIPGSGVIWVQPISARDYRVSYWTTCTASIVEAQGSPSAQDIVLTGIGQPWATQIEVYRGNEGFTAAVDHYGHHVLATVAVGFDEITALRVACVGSGSINCGGLP